MLLHMGSHPGKSGVVDGAEEGKDQIMSSPVGQAKQFTLNFI